MRVLAVAVAVAALAADMSFGIAQPASPATSEPPTPPGVRYESRIPPAERHAYFGELHLHTGMSFDAWGFGTKVLPDAAYKFGRGETVMVPASQVAMQQGLHVQGSVPAKRAWPLDFMAVTDHAEWMGVLNQLDDPSSPVAHTEMGQKVLADPHASFYLRRGKQTPEQKQKMMADLNFAQSVTTAWSQQEKAANDNYEPGKFTTFVAYEWTALAQNKYNMHRNVIFNSDHAPMPYTSMDSNKPEDLWAYLDQVRAKGIDVIAIPHNGNVSGGLMYDWNDSNGRPIDEHYAQERATNEPLTEIAQTKGQSDTVPELSPTDEFANFEVFDHLISWANIRPNPDGSFIRQAYGNGLVIQKTVGVNPFKFGVVGGSDIHNGLSTSDENAYASEISGLDPKTMLPTGDAAKRDLGLLPSPAALDMDAVVNHSKSFPERPLVFSSAGITGVWAEENTRNAIFAALKRKETFATTGTRIRVRMFAGWDFGPRLLDRSDWVSSAYAQGVPMGSDLPAMPSESAAPRFILEAVKDPDGANLDRIQIIKLWLEGGGYKEKIFDVALSGNRKDNPETGHAPAVGNTVDLKTGVYRNSIGAAVLRAVWKDPEFDSAKPAVYYARTLEIPTPRWSTLLAIRNKLPIPVGAPATIQERAWTSPIWYTPAKH